MNRYFVILDISCSHCHRGERLFLNLPEDVIVGNPQFCCRRCCKYVEPEPLVQFVNEPTEAESETEQCAAV